MKYNARLAEAKEFLRQDELAKLGPTQLEQLLPCKYIEKKN